MHYIYAVGVKGLNLRGSVLKRSPKQATEYLVKNEVFCRGWLSSLNRRLELNIERELNCVFKKHKKDLRWFVWRILIQLFIRCCVLYLFEWKTQKHVFVEMN